MEYARNATAIDVPDHELDESEDGSPPRSRTTQGPQRWIEQPYPRMT